jgi:hypothetical protein
MLSAEERAERERGRRGSLLYLGWRNHDSESKKIVHEHDYYQVALTRVINILQRSGCRQDCVEQGE